MIKLLAIVFTLVQFGGGPRGVPPGAWDYPPGPPPRPYLPPPRPDPWQDPFFQRCMMRGDCGHHPPPGIMPPPRPPFPPDYEE